MGRTQLPSEQSSGREDEWWSGVQTIRGHPIAGRGLQRTRDHLLAWSAWVPGRGLSIQDGSWTSGSLLTIYPLWEESSKGQRMVWEWLEWEAPSEPLWKDRDQVEGDQGGDCRTSAVT